MVDLKLTIKIINENDFIDFSSDEGEKYIKDGETNIYENEFANGFPQDYSDLLIEIILNFYYFIFCFFIFVYFLSFYESVRLGGGTVNVNETVPILKVMFRKRESHSGKAVGMKSKF